MAIHAIATQAPAREVERMPLRKPITLASGRTIAFTYLANGAQNATPTTGPRWMTPEEGAEFDRRCAETRR